MEQEVDPGPSVVSPSVVGPSVAGGPTERFDSRAYAGGGLRAALERWLERRDCTHGPRRAAGGEAGEKEGQGQRLLIVV
jgi:hypothetical protein